MKKHFLFLSCCALTVSMAQGQTASGGSTSGSAGGQTGSGTSAGQQQQSGAANAGQINPQTGAPNVEVGPTGGVLNEPAGANQAAGVNPGNTNRVLFGGTNQIQFGATNTGRLVNEPSGANQPGQIRFGTTNPVPFGRPNGTAAGAAAGTSLPTNNTPFAGSGTIQEPAGAANPNAANAGTALPNAGAADAVFAQQLNTALSRGGATRIFFPQTRSTVTLVNQNGSILLTGVVSSDQERRDIEAKVKNASGVNSVNNQLRVETGAAPMIAPPGQAPAPGIPRTPQSTP